LEEFQSELFFLDYAPLMLVSAKTGAELTRLFKTIERIRKESSDRIGTGVLNRLLKTATTAHPPPSQGGKRLKILYGTQADRASRSPISIPEIVLFVNDEKLLVESYRRFLERGFARKLPTLGSRFCFTCAPANLAALGSRRKWSAAAARRPAPASKHRRWISKSQPMGLRDRLKGDLPIKHV
jgi:predicted GTPase